MRLRRTRHVLSAVAVIVAIALLPLFNVSPQAVAEPSAPKNPASLPPMPAGKAKTLTPEAQQGDFSHNPKTDQITTKQNLSKGDHFKPGVSRLIDHTPTSDIYDNGDGTKSSDIYGAPVNFKDASGNWQRTDPRLVSANGKVHNASGPVSFELNASTVASGFGKVSIGANSVSFGIGGVTSGKNGTISDNGITYANAFANTDVHYEVLGSQLKEPLFPLSDTHGV